ncbi:dynamin family protein [Heyndrickxia ginsengihumi]|uniref:dynamin family protein n=1 Tax=Heyndrickxia ginsengihumi TaxID=363870 RepID=UPI0020416C01|nr:dynamin family protein [Heyndrickxia ginsengihumi]MCM3024412.1 dynamin family protein [Heyndrickxia ginsengihumi]
MLKGLVIEESNILSKTKVSSYLMVGTMSSGKSTFLNSLIGLEIFPSKNEACTAKVISYIANPVMDTFLYLKNNANKPIHRRKLDASHLNKWNEDEKIKEIIIEGPSNTYREKHFCVIDTPGPNNSMDKNHEVAMERAIQKGNYKKVFYLLNASQLGTEDDKRLLHFIKENCDDKNVLFVVNKSDVIDDTEEENLTLVSKSVEKYLTQNGFKLPKIYFVSSLAALLAIKVTNNIVMTRKESTDYRRLTVLLDKKLSEYNLNVSKRSSSKKKVASFGDPLWIHSGIPEILSIL